MGATLAGAGAGAFLGHEMKGGPVADIGGALLGAFAAHEFEKHEKKKHERRDEERREMAAYDGGIGMGYDGGIGSRGIDEERGYDGGERHHHRQEREERRFEEIGDFRQEEFHGQGRY
jgi:uncharacterized protein YcfJ